MADIGWARSRGNRAEKQGLRRGAWYRVVEDEKKDYVVLDVHHVEVRMDRGDLEVRKDAPKAWSGCHARYVVAEGAKDAKCPECGRTYPIDWKDAG